MIWFCLRIFCNSPIAIYSRNHNYNYHLIWGMNPVKVPCFLFWEEGILLAVLKSKYDLQRNLCFPFWKQIISANKIVIFSSIKILFLWKKLTLILKWKTFQLWFVLQFNFCIIKTKYINITQNPWNSFAQSHGLYNFHTFQNPFLHSQNIYQCTE